MVLAIGSTIAAWIYRDQRNDLQHEQARTKVSLQLAERAQRKAHLELGKSLMAEGTTLARSGLVGQRFDSLDRLARAARVLRVDPEGRGALPELRDQAIAAMGLTDLGSRWERKIGAVMSAACDPELNRYAVVDYGSRQPIVRRLDDDRELFRVPRLEESFWHAFPVFSPDGG